MTTHNHTDGSEQQGDGLATEDLHEMRACGGDCPDCQRERAEEREELYEH